MKLKLPCAALLILGIALATYGDRTAAAQPPPVEAFAGQPGVQVVAISPNGQMLATDRSISGRSSVEIYEIAAGKLRRTIDLGTENKLWAFSWADDRTLLVDVSIAQTFGSSPSKMRTYEWKRTMAVDIDDGSVQTMLLDDGDRKWVTGSTLHATRPGRPDIVVMSTWDHSMTRMSGVVDTRLGDDRRDSGWVYTLFDVNTRTGKGTPTALGTQYTQEWAVDSQGRAIARSEWNADRNEFTIVAKDGATWKEVYRRTDGGKLELGGLAPDSRNLLALGENGTDRSKVWAIALDGSGAKVYFEAPDSDVDSIWWDTAAAAPLAVVVGGLVPRIHYLDPKLQARQATLAKAFPGQRVSIIDRSEDDKRVIVTVSSPSRPQEFYLVDFTSGKADLAGETWPALAGVTLGEVRAFTYPARDGTQIPTYLTLPPGRGEKNLPMVVLPHSGPEGRDEFRFDWEAQFLATRGYAVLQPQFRGSTGFGRAHRLAGYRQWGGLMQDDVTDGVKEMIRQGIADPTRICISGGGYGGYAALAGAAFTPELYTCAVSINGVTDLPAYLGDGRRRGEQSNVYAYSQDHIGTVYDPNLAARSPARAAENIKAPILLVHAVDDAVVPVRQSETMARALSEAGKTYAFVKLPGEDHWLIRSEARTQVFKEIEVFLARYLGSPDQ